jgi:outer membrane beta-barrel protein
MTVNEPRFASAFRPPATLVLALVWALAWGIAVARAEDLPGTADSLSALAASDAGAESEPAPAVAPTPPAVPVTLPAGAIPTARVVELVRADRNVVHTGPGDEYAVAGVYPRGATLPVIAKRGAWYGVRLSPNSTGWIHSSLCKESADVSDLEFRPNPKLYSRTGSYIATGYVAGYAFDRKSNSLAIGGRLGYFAFDRVQVEAGASWTHVHRPAEIVESLFGLTLEAEDFHMLFYHLVASYELLPGRQMVPYLTVGAGATVMRGESDPSYDFGAGTMLYLSKRTAMRWEVRDYRFTTGEARASHSNDNIEFSVGTAVLF